MLSVRFIATVFSLSLLFTPQLPLASAKGSDTGEVRYVDQGWNQEIRQQYYYTPQGSRIMPAKWFVALEGIDGEGLFSDREHLSGYGLVPAETEHTLNPYGLAIGLAIDPVDKPGTGKDIGLTCAACHSGNITVEGKILRVDGAPANFDFDLFYADLSRVVSRTLFDEKKFAAFASRTLPTGNEKALQGLKLRLALLESRMAGDAEIRKAGLESGFGRVDALTQIINALAVSGQKIPENLRSVEAPTSYPHLWLAPHLEFVQWNPIASSPIARNGGEVLGVFGLANLHSTGEDKYESSLLLANLAALEEWLATLQPPIWDEALMGALDAVLVEQGKALYTEHCDSCHTRAPYRMTAKAENAFGKQFIAIGRVNYREVGTDPLYVDSLLQRLVQTNELTRQANDNKPVVPALQFFLTAVGPVLERAMNEAGLSKEERIALSGFRFRPPASAGETPQIYRPPSFTDIKAGPLAGIWATGPFLHNGSVATVYELLSPESERRAVFFTGGRELDRVKLGFKSENAPGRFRFDTRVPGNRNSGHLYPPEGLDSAQRMAIIEFIKTLQ